MTLFLFYIREREVTNLKYLFKITVLSRWYFLSIHIFLVHRAVSRQQWIDHKLRNTLEGLTPWRKTEQKKGLKEKFHFMRPRMRVGMFA